MKQIDEVYDESQIFDIDGVPMSAVIKVVRPDKYGTVPDLDDEELADPEELERVIFIEDYAPLLLFP